MFFNYRTHTASGRADRVPMWLDATGANAPARPPYSPQMTVQPVGVGAAPGASSPPSPPLSAPPLARMEAAAASSDDGAVAEAGVGFALDDCPRLPDHAPRAVRPAAAAAAPPPSNSEAAPAIRGGGGTEGKGRRGGGALPEGAFRATSAAGGGRAESGTRTESGTKTAEEEPAPRRAQDRPLYPGATPAPRRAQVTPHSPTGHPLPRLLPHPPPTPTDPPPAPSLQPTDGRSTRCRDSRLGAARSGSRDRDRAPREESLGKRDSDEVVQRPRGLHTALTIL